MLFSCKYEQDFECFCVVAELFSEWTGMKTKGFAHQSFEVVAIGGSGKELFWNGHSGH